MKTTKFLQALSFLLILIIAISCRSSRYSTGGQYPRNPSPQTETSTNTYPVQSNGGNLPPGQAKKIYGDQSAKAYAPGQRKKYPLVIVHTTNIVINQYIDGRYYYRNTAGYTYWKGDDGRYYLDEKHLKDVEYEEGDYDDWKFKGQKNNNAHGPKGKDLEELVKENQKTKDTDYGQNQKVKDNDQNGKGQFNQKEKGNDQNGRGQFNQKVKDNGQKEKDQSGPKAKDENPKEKDQADQKMKDNGQKEKDQSGPKAKDENPKEKDQADQKMKDNGQKEKDQSGPKAKDENPKEKDQADQKVKDNDQKGKDQADPKAKDINKKEKDQTDPKVKDDNPLKGKAKSKDKS